MGALSVIWPFSWPFKDSGVCGAENGRASSRLSRDRAISWGA